MADKPKDKDRRDAGGGKTIGEEGSKSTTPPSGTKEVKENLDVKDTIKHEKGGKGG